MSPVSIEAVRQASKKDLLEEWKPKLENASYFEDALNQAYVILTMYRVLYRAKHDNVASKRVASEWAKQTYGKPWSDLVEKAEHWGHGREMKSAKETMDFVRFTLKELE